MIDNLIGINFPKEGKEWKPECAPKIEKASHEEFENIRETVLKASEPLVKDDDFREIRDKAIEDPLAFYAPYHYVGDKYGIYFRIYRMIDDFKDFISKYYKFINKELPGINFWDIWEVYFATIFWHEMTHHIVEDIATVMEWKNLGKYPLLSRKAEERFCEFVAFARIRLVLPLYVSCRSLIDEIRKRRSQIMVKSIRSRQIKTVILSCLYYHWNRDDPNSIYRPIIEPEIPQIINGLWNAFWYAHNYPGTVIRAPDEIYGRIYFVTF